MTKTKLPKLFPITSLEEHMSEAVHRTLVEGAYQTLVKEEPRQELKPVLLHEVLEALKDQLKDSTAENVVLRARVSELEKQLEEAHKHLYALIDRVLDESTTKKI